MYLIKAIPIVRGIPHDFLSYISSEALVPGSVVSVPLRNKKVFGIVLASEHALDAKSEIRGADFEYKRLEDPLPRTVLPSALMHIVPELSDYYAASPGSVLASLVPKMILESHGELEESPAVVVNDARKNLTKEILALQEDDVDRFAHYRSMIRERFARGRSVVIVVPLAEDAERMKESLGKGIEDRTVVMHGRKTKKEIVALWNTTKHAGHPMLMIVAPGFFALPRNDIALMILDRENARSYKKENRPFLDMRHAAELYAREIGADLVYGDIALSLSTIARIENGEIHEYTPLSVRSLSSAKDLIVDMRRAEDEKKKFSSVSPELEALVRNVKETSSHAFVFVGRTGLGGATVCQDCGSVLTCDRCSAALALYGKNERRFFLCNSCGKRFPTETTCKSCGSWRLVALGIGTERVEEELAEKIPGLKIFRMDRMSTTTPLRTKKTAEAWLNTPGSILIGTELALPHITRPVDTVAVASLDSLFGLPDFSVEERVFSILLSLRAKAEKHLLVQTRFPDRPVVTYAVKGNIAEFIREEKEERRKLSFPPYATFIKISYVGKRAEAEAAIEEIRTLAEPYQVEVFPALIATVKNKFIMHALVVLPSGAWVDQKLLEKLRLLPPAYSVNVDPESIL